LRESARQTAPAPAPSFWRNLRRDFSLARGVLRRRYFVVW
jgi:hypothetical protein